MFANGASEDLAEDVPAVVEEFYPPVGDVEAEPVTTTEAPVSLRGRLQGQGCTGGRWLIKHNEVK